MLRSLLVQGSLLLQAWFYGLSSTFSEDVTNPLDGVKPDMSVLGTAFNTVWVRVAGAIWGLMLAATAMYLGAAFLNLAQARRMNNAHMMSDSAADVKIRAAALAGLVALPLIVGAIITVVS